MSGNYSLFCDICSLKTLGQVGSYKLGRLSRAVSSCHLMLSKSVLQMKLVKLENSRSGHSLQIQGCLLPWLKLRAYLDGVKELLLFGLHGGLKRWSEASVSRAAPLKLSFLFFHISWYRTSCAVFAQGCREPAELCVPALCSCSALSSLFGEVLLNFCIVLWVLCCVFLPWFSCVGNSFSVGRIPCETWLQ